ncbi:MAG: hypothetical protein DIZ80_03130 [endosymbiont of Galathealinum brachiosum]|uniref:Uncharacterized protein n=1 Tax=endosymbiont of Galathealinum brachiosum TaxID=2200906 RepID=A0A370DJL8_9GAMM|nr:MAG: hypothetical protein DIZ80_03130 [endosymbiont of Galathealinum brachiosum]
MLPFMALQFMLTPSILINYIRTALSRMENSKEYSGIPLLANWKIWLAGTTLEIVNNCFHPNSELERIILSFLKISKAEL